MTWFDQAIDAARIAESMARAHPGPRIAIELHMRPDTRDRLTREVPKEFSYPTPGPLGASDGGELLSELMGYKIHPDVVDCFRVIRATRPPATFPIKFPPAPDTAPA